MEIRVQDINGLLFSFVNMAVLINSGEIGIKVNKHHITIEGMLGAAVKVMKGRVQK